MLLGICSELQIRNVLCVQVSPHTRRTVEEHFYALLARPNQYLQKRWLEGFVGAAEAVQRKDTAEFARNVRFLRGHPLADDAFALAE